MTYIFLWEDPNGNRKWEIVKKNQMIGFLEKLLNDGVHPATIMCACSPILFHWAWKEYHNGISDVNFNKLNEEIYGTEPIESKHKRVDVPIEKEKPVTKYGWIAPDGRFFGCDYGGHSSLASKIVGNIQYVTNPERHLEEIGWAKVLSGTANRSKYTIGMGVDKKLTDDQIKTLQRMKLDNSYGISYFL